MFLKSFARNSVNSQYDTSISYNNQREQLSLPIEVPILDVSKPRKIVNSRNIFYVVPDPHYIMARSEYLKSIAGIELAGFGKVVIVLEPRIIHELSMKILDQDRDLAKRGMKFFTDCDRANSPFMITTIDQKYEKLISIDSARDEVLNTCLRIKKVTQKVVLLTQNGDLVLAIKAMSHEVRPLAIREFEAIRCLSRIKNSLNIRDLLFINEADDEVESSNGGNDGDDEMSEM